MSSEVQTEQGVVSPSWDTVQKCLEDEDWEKALLLLAELTKTNKALKKNEDVLRCRIYCYIQTGRFEKASSLCKSVAAEGNSSLGKATAFEYAYALYKLNQFGKSLAVVRAARTKQSPSLDLQCEALPYNVKDVDDQKLAILEAQLLYRVGSYRESLKIFSRAQDVDPENLTRINYEACRSLVQEPHQLLTLNACREAKSYELTYNAACVALHQECLADAEDLLDLAIEQCLDGQEEAALSDDRRTDLLLIRLQSAFLSQKQGRDEEALDFYRTVCPHSSVPLDEDIDSTVALAVTSNLAVLEDAPQNVPVLRGCPDWLVENMLVSSKDISAKEPRSSLVLRPSYLSPTTLKLTSQQLIPLIKNHCIATLRDGRSRECDRYLSTFPRGSLMFSKLLALAKVQERDYVAASRVLQRIAKTREDVQLEYWIRCFLMLLKGDMVSTAAQLASRHITATCLLTASSLSREALYYILRLLRLICPKHLAHIVQQANAVLQQDQRTAITRSVALAFGELMLEETQFDDAYKWFSYARGLQATPDVYSMVGELRSAAHCRPDLAATILRDLKQVAGSIFSTPALAQIDPDDVEQTVVGTKGSPIWMNSAGSSYMKYARDSFLLDSIMQSVQGGTDDALSGRTGMKARRRKRIRYPKGFDPQNPASAPPDPERWLPKHERSTYKKSKKGHARIFRGAQGVVQTTATVGDQGGKKASSANVEVKRDTKRRVKRNRK